MLGLLKSNVVFLIYALGMIFTLMAAFGWVRWPLLFVIGLLPLRNVIERFQTFPLGDDFFDVLLIGIFIGWIISAAVRGRRIMERSLINWAIIPMISYTFISLIYGTSNIEYAVYFSFMDPRVAVWKNFCIMPLIFLMVFNNLNEKKWIWRTVAVMCLSMALMDYYTITQLSWHTSIVSRTKIHGTFVFLGPNELAAFYNQYTIILMALFLSMRRSLGKLALGALIWANIYCVLFLFSRAAYAASAVGMFVLFAVRKKILLIPLLIVIICWNVLLPVRVQERINMTTNAFGELDESAANRLLVWERAVEIFQNNPIMGIGYGVFTRFEDDLNLDTHNIYLKILTEQGLIGFVIFLLLMIVFFFRGIKLYRQGDDELSRALGIGFACAIVMLMINNMFGDRWTYLELSSYLWIFAGLVEALNLKASQVTIELEESRRIAEAKKNSPAVRMPQSASSGQEKPKRKTYYNYYRK